MDSDERLLEDLVDAEDFEAAVALCQQHIDDAISGNWWLLQLGLVRFLDEKNGGEWLNAPLTFDQLLERTPSDVEAHFWRAYVKVVVEPSQSVGAIEAVQETLRLDPNHAYGQLIWSAYLTGKDRVAALEIVLKSQPGNLRALKYLAETLRELGDNEGSKLAYERIVQAVPHVESSYGIMNSYTNQVLNGSYWAEKHRRDAAEHLV